MTGCARAGAGGEGATTGDPYALIVEASALHRRLWRRHRDTGEARVARLLGSAWRRLLRRLGPPV